MKQRPDAPPLPLFKPGERVIGTYQSAGTRGGGFVVPESPGRGDLRVLPRDSGVALHGDRVEAQVQPERREGRYADDGDRGKRQSRASIVKILRHANSRIVGQLFRRGRACFVTPRNVKIRRLVEIRREYPRSEVPDGAWVIVQVREWSDAPEVPLQGSLLEVLGQEGDPGLTVLLILRDYDVSLEFPPAALAEAAALEAGSVLLPEYDPPRRDFRGERIVTIDPATAKDFDDAVGLLYKRPEGWRIGVHIADVAHYVQPGSAIDAEAYERATSIYPIDRVVPMLPEALSNDLCSLRPDVDRNVLSVVMTVTPAGKVREIELANAVIRSVRRFAYEEVQAIFNDVDARAAIANPDAVEAMVAENARYASGAELRSLPLPDIPAALHGDLMELRAAARAIRREREGRGALNLELPEPEIVFDSAGKVVDIRRRPHFEAHMMIEDFMVAANEAVAKTLQERHFPTLYRVHGEPDEDKLQMLAPVLDRFGIRLPARDVSQATLQAALEKARKHPSGQIVQRWVLRAMMRAQYQPENLGHYGLASENYLHFTSPIRRYPDLIVHRGVKALLAGARPGDKAMAVMAEAMPEAGKHCSSREQRSQKIEWDAEAMLGLQFMRQFVGDIFEGFISGVAPLGCFVELKDYPVEGLIHYRNLGGDFYEFDEEDMMWRGRGTGQTFALGDMVTVAIESVEPLANRMDLRLVRGKAAPVGTGKSRGKTKDKARVKGSVKSGRKTSGNSGKPGSKPSQRAAPPRGGAKRKKGR